MISNPLSICKMALKKCLLTLDPKFTQWLDDINPKIIPNPWVIRGGPWSLMVLDWNSPCSISHLCNDLIYTLVRFHGDPEIQVDHEVAIDKEMCKVYK